MADLKISVRELVEFLLRSGDLDNRIGGAPEDAMLAGAGMHRKLQAAAGSTYRAEVPMALEWRYTKDDLGRAPDAFRTPEGRDSVLPASSVPGMLPVSGEAADSAQGNPPVSGEAADSAQNVLSVMVEGRADGLFAGEDPLEGGPVTYIDEIKTTYRNLKNIRRPETVHLAQAKCYAFMQAVKTNLSRVGVRMTYCSLLTEEIHYFYEVYDFEEIEAWFAQLMELYRPWAAFRSEWKDIRTASIRTLEFPFPYRPGQKDLASAVYRTIVLKRKLFLEAPTGTGKTISTLFPAVKALGEGKADAIFYLTARTIARTAAENALASMQGLRLKSVTLTAREKICVLDKPECNPQACPRAKGHYSRVNAAMYDLLIHEDAFTRTAIEECALRHEVCPFELGLDMSLYADLVIGDYNYLFSPRAGLRRFFSESASAKGEYLFLIDEAHNLVDRGREMYSASLVREDILNLRRRVKDIWPKLARALSRCSRELLAIRRKMEEPDTSRTWAVLGEIDDLGSAAETVHTEIGTILSQERIAQQSGAARRDPQRRQKQIVWDDLLTFYFDLDHFLSMLAGKDDHYVIYAQKYTDRSADSVSSPGTAEAQAASEDIAPAAPGHALGHGGKHFMVKLFCTDPSRKLAECMDRGRASILFSATLLPITYYKALLGGTGQDYEIYARSVFDPKKLGLFLVRDLSSRYRERTPDNYDRIASCIYHVIRERHGNYMVFFPSYAFMEEIAGRLTAQYEIPLLKQKSRMSEEEREAFLSRFGVVHDDRSLVGLCVMGGIFSEGIDLQGDRLIGVIVVGTGIPQVNAEREILKDYFDEHGDAGYDYAYRCPGMNKVQQAAGRVIRTREDVGIVVLIDERFVMPSSRRLFPREWQDARVTDSREVGHLVERFWDEWL